MKIIIHCTVIVEPLLWIHEVSLSQGLFCILLSEAGTTDSVLIRELSLFRRASIGRLHCIYMYNNLMLIRYLPCLQARKPPMPYTKQQLLQKVTPILPPASYKSHRSHPPTSPGRADSVESSDSEGYEDVMSDEEEGAVVKSQWTTGATPTTAPAEVSCSAAIQRVVLLSTLARGS